MAYADRQRLISALEGVRGSKVITYFLSDRETFPPGLPGFSGLQIANEPHLMLIDQLRAMGRAEKIDLFLYTRGGHTDAVWPLVSSIREHCDVFSVLVPFRAHSAGTLICLGADQVIMTDEAELSPIDPSTLSAFNPRDPSNPQVPVPIGVEDVTAYFRLSEERAGLKSESAKLEVFKELTRKVDPLALGNVERVYLQIRQLARNLLAMHMDEQQNEKKFKQIIEGLTEKFYSHVHAITRREAIALLGSWVKPPNDKESPVVGELFESYADILELRTKFSLPHYMQDEATRDLEAIGGFIETSQLSHIFSTKMKAIQRPNLPPGFQMQVPPSGQMPLPPFFTRSYEFNIQTQAWQANTQGV